MRMPLARWTALSASMCAAVLILWGTAAHAAPEDDAGSLASLSPQDPVRVLRRRQLGDLRDERRWLGQAQPDSDEEGPRTLSPGFARRFAHLLLGRYGNA